jgi:hypothetical protein
MITGAGAAAQAPDPAASPNAAGATGMQHFLAKIRTLCYIWKADPAADEEKEHGYRWTRTAHILRQKQDFFHLNPPQPFEKS